MIGWILAAVLYVIGSFLMLMLILEVDSDQPRLPVRWWAVLFWPVIVPAALVVGLAER